MSPEEIIKDLTNKTTLTETEKIILFFAQNETVLKEALSSVFINKYDQPSNETFERLEDFLIKNNHRFNVDLQNANISEVFVQFFL